MKLASEFAKTKIFEEVRKFMRE